MDLQSAEAKRLAKEALQAGDAARVLQLLGPVVQAFPNDVDALMMGGIAFGTTGDAARALSLFDRAAALQPDVPAIHYNRAMALERAGRPAEAMEAYRRTIALQPNHAPASQRLAVLSPQPPPPAAGVPGFPPPPPNYAQGFPAPPAGSAPQSNSTRPPDPSMVINNSVASNPGRISLQWPVFLRCYPTTTIVYLVLIGAASALAVTMHWGWWILAAILALLLGKLALNAKMIFHYGCACPGVVVSHDPDLIAVCTDLDTGGGKDYWVIKVLPHPLKRMSTGRPPVGTRIATVAGYGPGDENGHWQDFMPVAAACATADRQALKRILESFEDDDWQSLETGLQRVTERTPGLYPFQR
jgi:hypothetical protein